jgi:hypothetical protein
VAGAAGQLDLRTLIDSAVDQYVEQHRRRYVVQVER